MRRRLALVGLATTTLVVITFVVPLALLVRRQAEDRARVDAERQAQATASLIALAVSLDGEGDWIGSAVGQLDPGVVVALPDGSTLGQPFPGQGSLIEPSAASQATITSTVEGGWEIALPVIGRDGVVVVDVLTTSGQLTEGVAEAWLLLGGLGIVVVAAAVWVADRLGRRLVESIGQLEDAAHAFALGDLERRVEVDDPPELKEVGDAFNKLAARLDDLLAQEREAVADLSHRLRTPLTSLRLQTENLSEDVERLEVLAQVDRLELAIDQLIVASRTGRSSQGTCRLNEVVAGRAAFWSILAEEQDRTIHLLLGEDEVELALPAGDVEAVIDVLMGNVFAHTDRGVSAWLSTGVVGYRSWLEVADEGSGFSDAGLIERGASGAGSTGLGLDIVRRLAESTGGSVELNDRPGGGAVVRLWFG
jgi:signal transduction histidine kinase